ncbi:hypothetical protein ACROYT_G014719 [Oculina patagonica]
MPSLVAYTVVAVDAFRGRLHRGRCGCLPWSPRLEWLPRMLSVVTSTAVFRGRLHCGRRGCLLLSPWMLSLVASTVIAVVAEIGDHVVKVVWLPRMLSDVTSTAVASTLVVVASTEVAVNAFLGRLHLVDSTVVAADADDSDRFTVPGPPSFAFAVLSTLPWSPISNLYRNPDQSGEMSRTEIIVLKGEEGERRQKTLKRDKTFNSQRGETGEGNYVKDQRTSEYLKLKERGQMEKNNTKRTDTMKKPDDEVRVNIEHIIERHVLPAQKGTSYFLTSDVQEIFAIIMEAYRRPNKRFPHRTKRDHFVFQKKFTPQQLGVHGISQAPCYSVTGIFNGKRNVIITAYPTV